MASLQDMASGYGLLSYPGSQMFPPAESAAPVAVPAAASVAPVPEAPQGPDPSAGRYRESGSPPVILDPQ